MLSLAFALALLSADAPRLVDAASTAIERVGEGASAAARIVRRGTEAASYAPEARAVTNWRHETAHTLDPQPLSALAALFQLDRPVVTRCVKLNNYWCIKRAGWNGEVGSDDEGHTGFASAEHGADAAATLLRRYYLEFGRRSALDIVRRWAPAECRTVVGGSALPGVLAVRGLANTLRARWLAARRRPQAPRIRLASAGNAIPLPSHAPQAQAAPSQPKPAHPPQRAQPAQARPRPASVAPRASAVPMRPLPTFRMPDIAAGVGGERKVVTLSATLAPRAPIRRQPTPASIAAATRAMEAKRTAVRAPAPTASRPAATAAAATPSQPAAAKAVRATIPAPKPVKPAAAPAVPPARPVALAAAEAAPAPALPVLRPIVSCASDEQRIQNYAARIVQGLGLGPRDDLRLFGDDGRPLPNLARVMLAMSSVELGALRASAQLVEGAVARVALRVQAQAQAAVEAGAPGAGAIPTPPI